MSDKAIRVTIYIDIEDSEGQPTMEQKIFDSQPWNVTTLNQSLSDHMMSLDQSPYDGGLQMLYRFDPPVNGRHELRVASSKQDSESVNRMEYQLSRLDPRLWQRLIELREQSAVGATPTVELPDDFANPRLASNRRGRA